MNNKEKLQEQFEASINSELSIEEGLQYMFIKGQKIATTSCTIVCLEEMKSFSEWLYVDYYYTGDGLFAARNLEKLFTLNDLLTLYNNTKHK